MQKDDVIYRQAAIDAADRADYTGLAVEDVKKVTDEVVKELKQLPPAQPEHDDEVTFWEKRANEYEAMLGELMIKIAKGMTVDSIVINKDGIVFKESQPEIAENLYLYKCYITDQDGHQHEVIHTGDIKRVTGWEI